MLFKCPLFNGEQILINALKVLSHSLIEDYTEIFCMTDEGDIPFIHCKISPMGLWSVGKIPVDDLNLIVIKFYVPALIHISISLKAQKSKSKLCYDLLEVGQSLLESGTHEWPMIRS
jgi:hypothetical protein